MSLCVCVSLCVYVRKRDACIMSRLQSCNGRAEINRPITEEVAVCVCVSVCVSMSACVCVCIAMKRGLSFTASGSLTNFCSVIGVD